MKTQDLKDHSISNQDTYWGPFIGCLAVFLFTLGFLEWIFNITPFLALISRFLIYFLGFFAQYSIYGSHIFRKGDYSRGIERREKTALMYGQEFKFKSILQNSKHTKTMQLVVISAFSLLYIFAIYLILKTPILMNHLELSAIIVGLSIAAINQPSKAWWPPLAAICSLFFKGIPKDVTTTSGFLFFLSIAFSFMLFAVTLRSIYESNASNENSKFFKKILSEVKISKGHLIALGLGAFVFFISRDIPTKELNQKKKPKTNQTKLSSDNVLQKNLKGRFGSFSGSAADNGSASESESYQFRNTRQGAEGNLGNAPTGRGNTQQSGQRNLVSGQLKIEGVQLNAGTGLGNAESGLGNADSGLGNAESGLGNADSGLGNAESGLGNAESGLGNAESGLGNADSGLGNTEAGLGNTEAGLGNTEAGLGNAESGLGNQESGRSNAESGLGNQESGLGNQESGLGNAKGGQGKKRGETTAGSESLENPQNGKENPNLNRQTSASQGFNEPVNFRKKPQISRTPKEKKNDKPKEFTKILLLMGLIGAMAFLFTFLTKKKTKNLKHASRSVPDINPVEAQKYLNLINEIKEDGDIQPTMSPQRIREKIISLYNLLIAANSHLGFQRSIDMTPDEYQAQLAKVAPHKQDGMIFVTRVYSLVFYGNQLPNFSQFKSYINAVHLSVLDI